MKTYIGNAVTREVEVLHVGLKRPLKHHVHHSPDGFAWGYGGSGPSELARCILLDYFDFLRPAKRQERTDAIYHDFKFAFIESFPIDEDFRLTSGEIEQWLAAHASGKRGGE